MLRIEDLDRQRCKPEFESALCEDLKWAGLAWDEGPFRQTERLTGYEAAWRQLAQAGAIYPCQCTRRDVTLALSAPHVHEAEGEPLYPGTCRPPTIIARAESAPGARNWRFRVPPGEEIRFLDACAGEQSFVAGRDFGDFLIWRKDGWPAYHLAVVVDDAAMQITEVVRGADLLEATAQQMLLYRALGLRAPSFHHCPLVTGPDGRRLAKRAGALSLRAQREAGARPAW